MKILRSSLVPVFAVAFLLAAPAFADDAAAPPADAAKKSEQQMQKAAQQEQKALDKWAEKLSLTADQKPKFDDIMKDSYAKMVKAKEAAAGDKEKMKASFQGIFKDRDDALAKLLTPEQMTIYRDKITNAANNMKSYKGKHGRR